jgi:hypothetical protein
LSRLHLNSNLLSGWVPKSIINLTALEDVDITGNTGLCASRTEAFEQWADGVEQRAHVVDWYSFSWTWCGPVSVPVTADGAVDFEGTGVRLHLADVSGSGDVTVESMNAAPADLGGLDPETLNAFRLVIDVTDDLTFDSNTEIRVDVAWLDPDADPYTMVLYRRPDAGTGPFSALDTEYHSDTNELVATTDEFSEFVVVNETDPIPVELAQFTATLDAGRVQLRWTTASETNNAGFEVEREIASGAFEGLGFVDGVGTTSETQDYRFTDRALPFTAETLRYRLRQVDHDGTTAYSAVVEVQRAAPTQLELQTPFPNPAYGVATIRYALPDPAPARLEVYDLLGRPVRSWASPEEAAGRNEYRLDTRRLSAGTYFVRLVAGRDVRTTRLVIVR